MVDIIFSQWELFNVVKIMGIYAIHTSHSPYSFGNDIVLRIFSGDRSHMIGLSHNREFEFIA